MEAILLMVTISILNIVCFFVGAGVGQKVARKEKIELNPIKAVSKAKEEYKDKKAKEEEETYISTIMYNIDHYNGSSLGQKKIPTRK